MTHSKTSGKRHRKLGLLLLVLVLIASYVGFALSRPLPTLAFHGEAPTVSTQAATPLTWPSFGGAAVGAVGYGVLSTNGTQTPMATASIIKVLTALAVLKQKPIAVGQQGPTITLDAVDVGYHDSFVAQDGSVVSVSAGEQITEYQMLQALLLPSANNIADSLARWSSGSVEAFMSYANDYAKQLGLNSITMTDPSGLAGSTVASPADLVKLGELALANPTIAEIVGQNTATIPVAGQIYNVNALLGRDGTIGIKTGNNDADLGAYLFASKQQVGGSTVMIVGVVMNGPSLSAALSASLPLITSATQNFNERTLVNQGQHIGYYDVPWQGRVPVVADTSVKQLTWAGDAPKLSLDQQLLANPTDTPAAVGMLSVQNSSGKSSNFTNLILRDPIHKPSFNWRLTHAFSKH